MSDGSLATHTGGFFVEWCVSGVVASGVERLGVKPGNNSKESVVGWMLCFCSATCGKRMKGSEEVSAVHGSGVVGCIGVGDSGGGNEREGW